MVNKIILCRWKNANKIGEIFHIVRAEDQEHAMRILDSENISYDQNTFGVDILDIHMCRPGLILSGEINNS